MTVPYSKGAVSFQRYSKFVFFGGSMYFDYLKPILQAQATLRAAFIGRRVQWTRYVHDLKKSQQYTCLGIAKDA